MLKNFWYACEFSAEITNKPKRITMLNQDFVRYRDSQGQAIALKDLCAHRGAALSLGKVEEDCIRCPYHGWKYQSNGTCIEIPANQSGVLIPKRARVDAYPVQEKYGLVWLFWGDLPEKERPPLPFLPEFGDPAFRCVYGDFTWNAHYTRVLDNLIDISHLPFIHPNSQGRGRVEEPQIEEYDVHLEEWSASATVTGKKPKKTRAFWKPILNKQGSRPWSVTVTFYMPNITRLKFDFPIGSFKLIIFSAHLPIDSNTTVSKWLFLRNFITVPWADRDARKRTLRIMLEDKPVVESQRPRVVPYDLAAELHVPADSLSIAYRQLRQKCLDMGWGIEPHINKSGCRNVYIREDSNTQKIKAVI